MSCSESLEGINFLSLLGFGSHTCDWYEYTHKCLNGFPRELKETPQRAQLRRREHAGIPDGQLGFKRPGKRRGSPPYTPVHNLGEKQERPSGRGEHRDKESTGQLPATATTQRNQTKHEKQDKQARQQEQNHDSNPTGNLRVWAALTKQEAQAGQETPETEAPTGKTRTGQQIEPITNHGLSYGLSHETMQATTPLLPSPAVPTGSRCRQGP